MIKKFIAPLFIFLVVLVIFFANYSPGTILSGWDNLHPEFNFAANIKRSIFAVWQEYQGLGLLGGMGHAADLPRQLFLLVSSVILPTNFLRYFYTFLMLFLGPLGMYLLLMQILSGLEEGKRKVASLLGAFFYLFNLATIQNFYFTFDPFVTHFGFLPLLFWALLTYLQQPTRKKMAIFLLINIFAIPQGYVPTVFLVYLISLLVFLLVYLLLSKNLKAIKNSLKTLVVVFCLNAFWILPFAYFTLTNSKVTTEAKINQMYTEESFLKNQKFGYIKDAVILHGFWFDNVEPINGGPQYIMASWRYHLDQFRNLGYALFLVVILGIFYSLRKREKIGMSFLPILVISFGMIANAQEPFLTITNFLRNNVPLFAQIFRFPFMKFSTVLSFVYAVFFAYGVLYIFQAVQIIKPRIIKNILEKSAPVLLFFSLIVFLFPVFQGQLFYFKLKSTFPKDYFELFKYFQTQNKNGRIANFPQATFNGWLFYRFNYSGSGFLWYGIEQPILDRAFDVWSREDENYYWEISNALYSKNPLLFEQVLEKYQVTWILVDENVESTSSPKSLFFDEIYDLMSQSGKINLAASFGKVKVYEFRSEKPIKNYVFWAENLPGIDPDYKWGSYDQAYFENGNYVSPQGYAQNKLYYPFRSLFSGRTQDDLEFSLEDKGDYYSLKKVLPRELNGNTIRMPGALQELISVDPNTLQELKVEQPQIYLDGKLLSNGDNLQFSIGGELEVRIPKVGGYYSFKASPATDPVGGPLKNCDQFNSGSVARIKEKDFLRLEAINGVDCGVAYWIPNTPHFLGYLLTVKSQHLSGKPIRFWLENTGDRKADIETDLPKTNKVSTSYFVIPPMADDGLSYAVHFDNVSPGWQKTINRLGEITMNQFPYRFLTQLKITNKDFSWSGSLYKEDFSVFHPSPYVYKVQMDSESQPPAVLALSQSYNSGWYAYEVSSNLPAFLAPVFGKSLKDHVLVSNWANGWVLPEDKPATFYLVYLPQYLEFFGFLFGILGFVWGLARIERQIKEPSAPVHQLTR